MPIDLVRAKAAVADGLAFPCGLCINHWEGVDKGGSSCGRTDCGGPLSGFAFPKYAGPLPLAAWSHFCFRCGSPHNLTSVKVIGEEKLLAICVDHRRIVDDAEAGTKAPSLKEIVFQGAEEHPIGQAPAKGKILILGPVPPPTVRIPRPTFTDHPQPCHCGKCPDPPLH